MQPAARCDAIGYVGEFVRTIDADEILEDRSPNEIGMQLSNSIDFMASNCGEIGHSNHLRLRFFNDRNTREHIPVLGKAAFDHLQKVHIDVVDDL